MNQHPMRELENFMKYAIIGSGKVGTELARTLVPKNDEADYRFHGRRNDYVNHSRTHSGPGFLRVDKRTSSSAREVAATILRGCLFRSLCG